MPGRLARSMAVVALVAAACGGTSTGSPTAATSMPTPAPTATPAAATLAPVSTPTPTVTTPPTIGQPADDGARIIAVESPAALQHTVWVDPGAPGCPADSNPGCLVPVGSPVPTTRVRDLTIASPAVGVVHARLLLPQHFSVGSNGHFPVFYLHHGGDTDYRLWTEALDAAAVTSATDLLVVMADGGVGSSWETFHLVELRQLLERNWQAGDKRAVAGMSMGGYEAMAEAESQPGFFRFAASYSGNPTRYGNLAALAGTALYVAYGNGQPGPLDNPQVPPYDERGREY